MILDRSLQRSILQSLADEYPGPTKAAWQKITRLAEEDAIVGNLLYMEEHGLVESGLRKTLNGSYTVNIGSFKITARGLDFLQDDGGLSAILGVVTIKIHDDTIKQLIEAKILQSDLPPEEKKRWSDQLRSLPAETTKHLVLRLVDKGLESGPAALAAIGSLLGIAS